MSLSISVVNFRGERVTSQCLPHLIQKSLKFSGRKKIYRRSYFEIIIAVVIYYYRIIALAHGPNHNLIRCFSVLETKFCNGKNNRNQSNYLHV